MKTILVVLLLVSSSLFAQGYGYYLNNQLHPMEQRQLQKEFLDRLDEDAYYRQSLQRMENDIDRMVHERKARE